MYHVLHGCNMHHAVPMLYWRIKLSSGKWTYRAADWSVDLCSHCEHVKVLWPSPPEDDESE